MATPNPSNSRSRPSPTWVWGQSAAAVVAWAWPPAAAAAGTTEAWARHRGGGWLRPLCRRCIACRAAETLGRRHACSSAPPLRPGGARRCSAGGSPRPGRMKRAGGDDAAHWQPPQLPLEQNRIVTYTAGLAASRQCDPSAAAASPLALLAGSEPAAVASNSTSARRPAAEVPPIGTRRGAAGGEPRRWRAAREPGPPLLTGDDAVRRFASGAGRPGEAVFCNPAAAGCGGPSCFDLAVVPQSEANPDLHYAVGHGGVLEMRRGAAPEFAPLWEWVRLARLHRLLAALPFSRRNALRLVSRWNDGLLGACLLCHPRWARHPQPSTWANQPLAVHALSHAPAGRPSQDGAKLSTAARWRAQHVPCRAPSSRATPACAPASKGATQPSPAPRRERPAAGVAPARLTAVPAALLGRCMLRAWPACWL
jgi:hypothetical protein